jgi:cytoskeletal protein RodZ
MGDYLRAARRRRRVSIDRAAEETRIRPDYLMRMESDEFDFLAPAYVRGFLRTYARFLRVSEDPLIQEFDRRYGTGRSDTSAILALENRARSVPRQRRRMSGWSVAATLAAIVLVAITVVGLANAPEEEPPREEVASEEEPTQAPSTVATPTPTPTPTESEDVLALTDGIEIELVAARARCWIEVTADGELLTPGGITLEVGDRSEMYTAEEDMQLVLGYAEGVDLIVNGRNLGAVGGPDAIVLDLPEDIRSFF